MAIARGFKTPGNGGQPCLETLNSVKAVCVCKLQISDVTALKSTSASNQIRSDSGHPRDPEQEVLLHLHV